MAVKLRALKQDLRVWNTEVFGNVSTKKLAALFQLGFWDAKKREKSFSMEEREVRRRVVEDFKNWAA